MRVLLGSMVLLSPLMVACSSASLQHELPLRWQAGQDVKVFWQRYLKSKGGLSWPASSRYPAYDQVKEGDTFMVELDQGPCLMEFFHGRWRRANDVWRWGQTMNDYGGCPYVFE